MAISNIDSVGFKNIFSFIDDSNNKMGLIDNYGNIIKSAEYDVINQFKQGGIAIFENNNTYGLLNHKGETIINNCEYIWHNKNYPIVFWYKDKETHLIGLINIYGNVIIKPIFKDITLFNKSGLAGVTDIYNKEINILTDGVNVSLHSI